MAANVFKPASDTPRRANVARPVAPAPEPEPVAAAPEAPAPEVAPVYEAPQAPVKPAKPAKPAKPRSTWSLFSLLDRITSMDGLFREGLPVHYLPHLLFVMLLTLVYIGNTHYGNRMSRSIQKLKQETEDLRADYTTLKSDYMEASKQSEVARKVAAIGLVESSSPPFRIAVPAGRLDEAELELVPVLTADTLAARAARDSAATHRADSLQGRQRRQLLNLPLDDTPEPGAPPPGLVDSSGTAGAVQHAVTKPKSAVRSKPTASKPAARPQRKITGTAKTAKKAASGKTNKPQDRRR